MLGETLLKDVNQHMYALIMISSNNINYVACKIECLKPFLHFRIFKFHHWTTKETVRYGFFHCTFAILAMVQNSALCLNTLYVEFSAEDEAVFYTCMPKLVLYKTQLIMHVHVDVTKSIYIYICHPRMRLISVGGVTQQH